MQPPFDQLIERASATQSDAFLIWPQNILHRRTICGCSVLKPL